MVEEKDLRDALDPVQAVLSAHGGLVDVQGIEDGVVSLSLGGGCVGCSASFNTAMQIYYLLMKLDEVKDVIFLKGELPDHVREFVDKKLAEEKGE